METFFGLDDVIDATRYFTNEQLSTLRKNMNEGIFRRLNRRQYIIDENITRVMKKYILDVLAELGLSEILGNNINFYFRPSFTDINYKNDSAIMNYVDKIGFGFNYGESYVGLHRMGDSNTYESHPRYMINITHHKITILPPAHHVKCPPYTRSESEYKISDSAKIKYVRTSHVSKKQQCGLDNHIIKSKLANVKERNIIYTKILLDAVVKFLFVNKYADKMLQKCQNLCDTYNRYFIIGAQSSVLYFLVIGKFRPHALHSNFIPMDIIRYIAKIVWESRYDNDVWGKTINNTKVNSENTPPIPYEGNIRHSEDRYASYDDYGPHGWIPWYTPRNPKGVFKL